ncbi:MAG TPA: copper-binding protein [Candidatus Binatia bacterium]|nr:copper-binding protein [Candidatus Binatia bacterium]
MKFKRKYLMGFALLLSAGCAAYQVEPLSANHPAYPDAAATPERPVSKILAYTKADIPSAQPVASVQQGASAPGEQQTVVGEGKVIATVPNASQIVVEHGEIKGFMDAMTMGYRVDPPSLLEGLKQGDKVHFTIDVPKKAIVRIEKGTALMAAAVQQEGRESQQAAQSEQKTVVGEGKVIATVPNASQIVVDHQEIKGFMEAMTMGYRVDPPSLLEGLKFGDKVRFTIDVPKKAIIKIEKLN